MGNSLEETLKEVVEWQKMTFPHSTAQSKAVHLLKEAKELYENPLDWEEVADIQFLLAGIADELRLDLGKIVRKKLEINKLRIWGKPDEEGVVEHVRSSNSYIEIIMPSEIDEEGIENWKLRMKLDDELPS